MARIEPETESFGAVWGYRDLLYGMVIIFMALASLAFVSSASKKGEHPNGALQFNLVWDWANKDDVDLWVHPPGGPSIGYSNRQSPACSLLRDDTGVGKDPLFDNREVIICRNAVPGEYIVNVQLFGTHDNIFPVHTHIEVNHEGDDQPMIKGDADLTREGDEQTVFRFTLGKEGNLLPSTVNKLFYPVRESHQ